MVLDILENPFEVFHAVLFLARADDSDSHAIPNVSLRGDGEKCVHLF
jgi:hypothetical protein